MIGRGVNIEVDGEELQKIFADISAAEITIRDCYIRLERLGVVKIKNPQCESEATEVNEVR